MRNDGCENCCDCVCEEPLDAQEEQARAVDVYRDFAQIAATRTLLLDLEQELSVLRRVVRKLCVEFGLSVKEQSVKANKGSENA